MIMQLNSNLNKKQYDSLNFVTVTIIPTYYFLQYLSLFFYQENKLNKESVSILLHMKKR